jgi:hypothetical protein|tara:strand:- start:51 stop:515 length:465 start_codon:yes stop_codon:yes gene_type:complete
MAITSAICNSFKQEILVGTHNFTASSGNSFKIALFTSSATLSKSTTAYTAPSDGSASPTNTHEVSSDGTGYTTGGNALTSTTPVLSGDTACCKFADTSISSASFTARGCLIYNSSQSNKAVCAVNFGADKTVTSGTFTIQFPAQTAGNAIVQIA